MKSYKVKIYSSDERFHDKQLVFVIGADVVKGTKLTWIEPLRDNASSKEASWHKSVSKLVVRDEIKAL